jgi:hypothetical protein
LRRIALQSAVGGMALSILGMFAVAFAYLPPHRGAIAQEIIDLATVLNVVRRGFAHSFGDGFFADFSADIMLLDSRALFLTIPYGFAWYLARFVQKLFTISPTAPL